MNPRERIGTDQAPVSELFPGAVYDGGPRDDRQPAPKRRLGIEWPGVTSHTDHRFLQGIASRLLIATREHDYITEKPIEISVMKLAECHLIPFGKAARQLKNPRLLCARRGLFHIGASGRYFQRSANSGRRDHSGLIMRRLRRRAGPDSRLRRSWSWKAATKGTWHSGRHAWR